MGRCGLLLHAVLKLGMSLKSNNGRSVRITTFARFAVRGSVGEIPSRVDKAPHNGPGCAEPEKDCGTGLNPKAGSTLVGSI